MAMLSGVAVALPTAGQGLGAMLLGGGAGAGLSGMALAALFLAMVSRLAFPGAAPAEAPDWTGRLSRAQRLICTAAFGALSVLFALVGWRVWEMGPTPGAAGGFAAGAVACLAAALAIGRGAGRRRKG